ncbi:MAG: serine hydrolase domain-containing protein, partial [Ignavibacteria bacterium]|nr:serine hydrolase domain-containing protein [Ignavibacteria bacterium]
MLYFRSFIKGILMVTFLFQTKANGQTTQPDSAIIQQLLQSQIGEDIPGILLGMERYGSPGRQWSAGYNDVLNKTLLNPDQTFRIASVTKTFVAVAILRLWEEDKIKLNDPISKYLCDNHLKLLIKGGYNPSIITIEHLLHHNSGLADHSHTVAYEVAILRSGYKWTRQRQIEVLVEYSKPVGKPGERFSYSDTGYV